MFVYEVGSLPRHVSELEVRGLIKAFLPIDSIEWMTDSVSGKRLSVMSILSFNSMHVFCAHGGV